MNYNQTLPEIFAKSVKNYPDRNAAVFHGQFTYAQLDKMIDEFALVLLAQGVRKGDRVAFLLPNSVHEVVAYWATEKIGAVVVAMNPMVSTDEILATIKLASPNVIITLDLEKLYEHNLAIYKNLRKDQILVVGKISDYFSPVLKVLYRLKTRKEPKFWPEVASSSRARLWGFWHTNTWQTLLTHPVIEGRLKENRPTPDDLAVLQATGGTTGVPKLAMLTHRNIVANCLQALAHVNKEKVVIDQNTVFLGVIPFFHVYGLSVCLNLAFAAGSSVVILPKFDAEEVLKAIAKYKADIFPAITRMYAALVALGEKNPDKLRKACESLRVCVSGAGALDLAVKAKWEKLTGKEIIEGYGLSEASPIVSVNPIHASKTGSMGTLVPDTELKLVHQETEKPVGNGEIGEIWIRGPQVMKGYWQNEEETKLAFREGGWLATGDLARMSREEFLWFAGRKKELIKVNGENVYPKPIEDVIRTCPGIVDVAVFGLPDEKTGERVVACVVLKDGTPFKSPGIDMESVVHGHCRENRLSGIQIPKQVVVVEEIPKTIVGKVLKRVLRDELLNEVRVK